MKISSGIYGLGSGVTPMFAYFGAQVIILGGGRKRRQGASGAPTC